MVSIVFPDFGPNVGKISWITGFWMQRPTPLLDTAYLTLIVNSSSSACSVTYHKREAVHRGELVVGRDLHSVS